MRRYRTYDYNGITYKSGWEVKVAQKLDDIGVPFEYETLTLHYRETIPRAYCTNCNSSSVVVERSYRPDFILPHNVILESKGKFTSKERKKHAFIKEQYPELDLRLLFAADNWLTKRRKKRYTQWCASKDIDCHVGLDIEGWVTLK